MHGKKKGSIFKGVLLEYIRRLNRGIKGKVQCAGHELHAIVWRKKKGDSEREKEVIVKSLANHGARKSRFSR